MTIDSNDPKLTAYVLGELDEKEHAEVEAAISQSSELRRVVDEIRGTTDLLTAELVGESSISLSPDQRAAIETRAARANVYIDRSILRRPWLIRRWWVPTSLAAVLLLGVTVRFVLPSLSRARELSPRISPLSKQAIRGADGLHTTRKTRRSTQSAVRSRNEFARVQRIMPANVNAKTAPNVSSGIGALADTTRLPGGRGVARTLQGGTGQDTVRLCSPTARNANDLVVMPNFNDGRISTRYYDQERSAQRMVPPFGKRRTDDLADLPARWAFNTEAYDRIVENPFRLVTQNPLSTFSIDVDTASYANMRRFLNQGLLPPPGAVRIEELVNYFDYDYPLPTGDDPFSVSVDVAECPWKPDHLIARIGIKGQEFTPEERPPANLVFLIDVSGSMQSQNKLPLLVQAMSMLVDELAYDDSVAIAVYAAASGLVLPSTPCSNKGAILAALARLRSGGSTNGAAGIQLAYDTATNNFIEGGANRVILATDGDFNVGVTNQGDLVRLIEEKAKSGVFLSVLGFGMGNYKDSTLEKLADKGNGNYAYIDTKNEAQKVLVEQFGGTLITIAKDVKIQIEFNPVEVNAYHLIGYENRILQAQDFNDDTKDAGEIGAGHTVTALYEIVPAGVEIDLPDIDPLKYQHSPLDERTVSNDESEPEPQATGVGSQGLKPSAQGGELMTVKLRYKQPDGDTSKLIEIPVTDGGLTLADMSDDFVFAASVASFGMLLRNSEHSGNLTFDAVFEMAQGSLGEDSFGYRTEFVSLVDRARALQAAAP